MMDDFGQGDECECCGHYPLGILGVSPLQKGGFYITSMFRFGTPVTISDLLDARPEIESKGGLVAAYLHSHGLSFLMNPSQSFMVEPDHMEDHDGLMVSMEWFYTAVNPLQQADFVKLRATLDSLPLPSDWALQLPPPTVLEFAPEKVIRKDTTTQLLAISVKDALAGPLENPCHYYLQGNNQSLQDWINLLLETDGVEVPEPMVVTGHDFIPPYECHVVSEEGMVVLSLTDRRPIVH